MSNQGKVSRVESSEEEYTQSDLKLIKEHFGIADMPLTEFERAAFKESLYFWRDLLRNRRMDEANELREKLSPISNLELCEPDLAMLYRLHEVIHFLVEGDIDTAKMKLKLLQSELKNMNIENLYIYNNNMGSLNAMRNNFEDGLKFYIQAFEIRKNHKDCLPDDEERLYHNMAKCYTDIEHPNRAIIFLNKISQNLSTIYPKPHLLVYNYSKSYIGAMTHEKTIPE